MDWYDAKITKPPKFKKMVLSYDQHAKHFIQEEKKKQLNTAPEKVFEGFKKSSQQTKTSKNKKKNKKK